jgi:hypothetical protein
MKGLEICASTWSSLWEKRMVEYLTDDGELVSKAAVVSFIVGGGKVEIGAVHDVSVKEVLKTGKS